ncbi:hypothetical protein AVEN_244302-1 [Araneus ventricosus]|uniref:Integrase zinc-binding domain-containing protein n=1 Tax=Araneus ventricosus TaxID=182803 RepID=A0A4Y2HQM6_ARAVE|nr:hypothetical protein AVEN_244302-1 [Araneus ventricosus]
MACCIGARLAHSVQQALNITEMETIFWSDSMVALYWLREKGGWSVFVSNRIKETKPLFPNVAWVLRFINNVRSRINERKTGQLTVEQIESAEIQLIRSVQAQSFPDENSIPNLCAFRDENNIIRVKTRITERIDTPHFLSPILLPNNCIFTERLVEHLYIESYHAGTQLLLSIIREKYWILGGRRTLRKIWNACVKCRRFKSKSPTADPVSLPADRVKNAAVFEVVGVDLAGPLYIKRGIHLCPLPSITS